MSGKTIFVARVKDPRGIFHSFVKEYGYYIIVPEDSINLSVLKKEYLFRLANTSRNGHAVVILLRMSASRDCSCALPMIIVGKMAAILTII